MKNKNVHISTHPLILDKVSKIRDKKTSIRHFRELMSEISMLLGYEALASLKLKNTIVTTPIGKSKDKILDQEIILVAILRAALGMIDGVIKLCPDAKMAHIGIYRNENTLTPVRYYFKTPRRMKNNFVLLVDPMLATGGSAIESAKMLKERGANKICFLCLLAAQKGLNAFTKAHPDIPVFVAAVDKNLNNKGYIVPGLGDAGDRTFGTL
ncbi:MAG: uracil phosphoribosyltransferase [Elusimicrobia bacterium]|nr:uracil phosphoribosyltransferase [Elusimicrobiota bacterium]